MKILNAAQMREIDRLTTERFGIPSLELMENAGTRVVEVLRERFPDLPRRKTVILCGKGNNGGDGFVVARLLWRLGNRPDVYLFSEVEAVKGDAAVNLRRWQELTGGVSVVVSENAWSQAKEALHRADLVVDALLGTGLTGAAQGLVRTAIEEVNRLRPETKVLAIDIPSGLPSDTACFEEPVVRADCTVTFTAPKLGQVLPPGSETVGELLVRDIGTPPYLLGECAASKIHWLEPGEFRGLRLRRKPASHKGDFGHALIVAGSKGKTGAAVLAAAGALRAGVGLVTVATPEEVLTTVASGLPEMMTEALASTEAGTIARSNLDYGGLQSLMRGKNVAAIGPGLSTNTETQEFARALVKECSLPLIIDADGLNAFVGRADELRGRATSTLVLTPHPGEMARLLGCTVEAVQQRRLETAFDAAQRWNAFVVLKGYRTVITTPDGQAFINPTGNPGMATAGTGDVLTGMLAGLTAQAGQFGVSSLGRVLAFGVYLHGLAGDLAAREVGEASLIASDLVQAIPRAFQEILSQLPTLSGE